MVVKVILAFAVLGVVFYMLAAVTAIKFVWDTSDEYPGGSGETCNYVGVWMQKPVEVKAKIYQFSCRPI